MRIHFEYPVRKIFFPFFMIAFIWILFALPLYYTFIHIYIFTTSIVRGYFRSSMYACATMAEKERKKESSPVYVNQWPECGAQSTECKFYAWNEMERKRMKNCLAHIIWWLRNKRKNIIWQMNGWMDGYPYRPYRSYHSYRIQFRSKWMRNSLLYWWHSVKCELEMIFFYILFYLSIRTFFQLFDAHQFHGFNHDDRIVQMTKWILFLSLFPFSLFSYNSLKRNRSMRRFDCK